MLKSKRVTATMLAAVLALGSVVIADGARAQGVEHDANAVMPIVDNGELKLPKETLAEHSAPYVSDETLSVLCELAPSLPEVIPEKSTTVNEVIINEFIDGETAYSHSDDLCSVNSLSVDKKDKEKEKEPAEKDEDKADEGSNKDADRRIQGCICSGAHMGIAAGYLHRERLISRLELDTYNIPETDTGVETVDTDKLNIANTRPSTSISAFRTISLIVGSYSKGTISLSTMVTSRQYVGRLGLRSISLQHYQNKRWMTVKAWSNRYKDNTNRFAFSKVASRLVSGDEYRVVATYVLRKGTETTTITRTSSPLQCK